MIAIAKFDPDLDKRDLQMFPAQIYRDMPRIGYLHSSRFRLDLRLGDAHNSHIHIF